MKQRRRFESTFWKHADEHDGSGRQRPSRRLTDDQLSDFELAEDLIDTMFSIVSNRIRKDARSASRMQHPCKSWRKFYDSAMTIAGCCGGTDRIMPR
ncbi:hypothetical protein [Burkholderia gladioli]|uniref:hypothetical protein n=1 Tax=Burkholderia gladioli TaxID=28095 RepID=UPI0012FE761B|nr:hypothetical protein [Burkholderia gladioli]